MKDVTDIVKIVGSAIGAIFLVWFFGFVFFPEFGKALGQDVLWIQILLVILGIAVVFGAVMAIVKR